MDCYVLKLNPRSKGSIKSAKIWIDKNDYLIRKITITSSENTTTYTLSRSQALKIRLLIHSVVLILIPD